MEQREYRIDCGSEPLLVPPPLRGCTGPVGEVLRLVRRCIQNACGWSCRFSHCVLGCIPVDRRICGLAAHANHLCDAVGTSFPAHTWGHLREGRPAKSGLFPPAAEASPMIIMAECGFCSQIMPKLSVFNGRRTTSVPSRFILDRLKNDRC